MTGIGHGIGAPASYFGQTFPTMPPYAGYAFGTYPLSPQAQQYVQPLQQQMLQQWLQIVLQQLQHVHNVQQQLLHHIQQLLQIVPQQLQQLQQLVQNLPQQLLQQPFQPAQQPFGTYQTQPTAAPWGFSATGSGVQPTISPQTGGMIPLMFGYAAQPGQVM